MSKESCDTCKYRLALRKYDYSEGGCKHTHMEGFTCMVFAREGIAVWMYGLDESEALCECYSPRKE